MSAVNSRPLSNPWNNFGTEQNEAVSLSSQNVFADLKQSFVSFIKSVPIVTSLFASISISLFLFDLLIDFLLKFSFLSSGETWAGLGLKTFYLSPTKVLNHFQVWRLFTYIYPQKGILIIIIHLLVTIPLSSGFERRTGSVKYAYFLNLFFVLFPSLLYTCLASFTATSALPLPPILDEGNIFFTLLVCQVIEVPNSNPCESCNVTPKLYPIVLFLLLSIFSSRSATMVQLFGLMIGYLYVFGYLDTFSLAESFIQRIEDMYIVSAIRSKFPARFVAHSERGFVIQEPTDLPYSSLPGATNSDQGNSRSGFQASFLQSLLGSTSQATTSQSSTNPSAFPGRGRRLGG